MLSLPISFRHSIPAKLTKTAEIALGNTKKMRAEAEILYPG